MHKNQNVCPGTSISQPTPRTKSSTPLRPVLMGAMLVTLIGVALPTSAWSAVPVEKGIATAFSVDYHTVQIEFETTMDLSTVIPANIKVTNRTDASKPLGTLGVAESFHPLTITGKPALSPNTYWLGFSGEMRQNGPGIVTISNMQDVNHVPITTSLTYWIDGIGIAPTANSLVLNTASNPTGATLVPCTVTFSEPVQNFDISDLVFTPSANVSYTGPFITGGSTSYTIEFRNVVASGNNTGTITCAFQPSPTIQDLAGNPLVTPVTLAPLVAQLDQLKPTVVSVTCPSPTNNPQFVVTFNKDVVNFNDPATDLAISRDVNSSLAWTGVNPPSGSGRVYTVSFQGVVGYGPLTLQVLTSDIRDAAYNQLIAPSTPFTVTVDTVQPRVVAITPTTSGPTSATSIGYTVQFDKPVAGFVAADLIAGGAGVNSTGAQVFGNDWDTTYSVQITGVSGNGCLGLHIRTGDQGSALHDQAGNKLYSSVTSSCVTIDNTGPIANNIFPSSAYIQGGTLPFTVFFNDSVKQFDAPNDLVITTFGTVTYAGTSIQGAGQLWTVFVAGISGEGTLTLAVNTKSNVCDLSNNGLISSVTSAPVVNVDITRPRVPSIGITSANPTNSTTASFSVHFSEYVKNFTDTADLSFAETQSASHAAATILGVGTPILGGYQDYTVNLTGVQGTGTISLAVNTVSDVKDLAGNSLDSSATSQLLVVDNTPPTVTVTPLLTKSQTPALGGLAGDNLAADSVNVTVNGHTHPAVLDAGTGTWSIAAWPDTLPQGTYDVAATVTDRVGNTAGDTTTNELTVDITAPTVTVNLETTGDTTPFVSGTVSDNVGVGSVTFTVNGHTYTATVSGNAWNGQVTDPLQTSLPYAYQQYDVQVTATDTAGNAGNDSTTNELIFDPNVPLVYVDTLFTSSSSPTVTGSASYKAPATDIASVSVTVNGVACPVTLLALTGSTRGWTANVPSVLSEGSYDVVAHALDNAVPERSGKDGSTNELTIDKQGPTATFALLEESPTNADAMHVTVTFNEPLRSTLDSSGLALSGTLKDDATVSVSGAGLVYTVTVTPNDPSDDGTIGIQLKPAVTDRALNPYAGSASPEWAFNNWCGFIAHPQGAGTYSGDPHTFHVQACFGNSIPVYAWKWSDNAKTVHDVGTDSPDLVVSDVTGKAGVYWCEVTYYGVTNSSNKGTLLVADHPSVVQEPQDAQRMVGDRCDFSVVAEGGFPPLTYEWLKDGLRINNATSNALSIAKIEWHDAGTYQAVVTDVLGTSAQSRLATLEVNGQPAPVAGLGGMAVLAGVCALIGCRSKSGRRK